MPEKRAKPQWSSRPLGLFLSVFDYISNPFEKSILFLPKKQDFRENSFTLLFRKNG